MNIIKYLATSYVNVYANAIGNGLFAQVGVSITRLPVQC